jgi:hypothetical protein
MAYSNAGLSLHSGGIGGSPKIFIYTSTDIHTDVDAANYFSDGVTFGMAVNDLVFVIKTTATVGATLHTVLSVSGDAATISPAILA